MTAKAQCPTCGRLIGLLASGAVRRHNDHDGRLCAGGTPDTSNVVQLRGGKTDRTRKAARMTAEERKQANEKRPPGKALDRAGHGVCGAKIKNKDGETCTNPKGGGTDHLGFGRCKHHGGASPGGKKHAALERARAEVAKVRATMTFYGRRISIGPEQVLLEEMQRTDSIVRGLEQVIAEWGTFERLTQEMDEVDPASDAGAALEARVMRRFAQIGDMADGGALVRVSHEDPRTGLPSLVAVHTTEKAVGFTDTEYRAWLKVFQEERKHLAAVAKACIDGNIAERRQQVLEARAEMIRRLAIIAMRLAGAQVSEDRALEIVAEATRQVAKELPA